MRNLIIILDPAHGSDVAGKCSPDKSHFEWKWSREICAMLKKSLEGYSFEVHYTNESDTEIGLTKRKNIADSIECPPKKTKFLLSLHNNGAGDGTQWMNARGYEIFTSTGKTNSDIFADIILTHLYNSMKTYTSKNRGSKEENFTVLMGSTYYACLLEWLFQDNKEDVELLENAEVNRRLVDCLVSALLEIDYRMKLTII